MTRLPNGIEGVLEYLAKMAAGYGNHLKWNEVAMLKADLMNVRRRWIGVSVDAISERCLALGMRQQDVNEIKDLVTKAQAGRRLVPDRSYRDHKFPFDVTPGEDEELKTSRIW